MSDTAYLRKSASAPRLEGPFQDAPALSLLRCMFGLAHDGDSQLLDAAGIKWEGGDYSVKEFAAFAGRDQWCLYKWLDPNATAQFPVSAFFQFVEFVRSESGGTDHRIADYVAELSGYAEKVRRIIKACEGR